MSGFEDSKNISKQYELKTILYNDIDNNISNVNYQMKTCCTDLKIIERLKKDGKLNPKIVDKEYLIPCDNDDTYIIGDKIASGGFNIVYNLKDDKGNILNDKVMRISKFHQSFTDEYLTEKMENTINGLFLQNYISIKCPYICKVYEFGYLIEDGKKTCICNS